LTFFASIFLTSIRGSFLCHGINRAIVVLAHTVRAYERIDNQHINAPRAQLWVRDWTTGRKMRKPSRSSNAMQSVA
jgi:hypothetical protein